MNDELDSLQLSRSTVQRLLPALLAMVLVGVVVALARLQCLAWDGSTNADGVSYLDLASRYAAGEWSAIGNGYWSPLYPMLLAAARRIAATLPGVPYSETGTVFTVNVALFAAVVLAFARLVGRLIEPRSMSASRPVLGFRLAAAGALCVWSLIRLVGATTVTPDGLLAALLFLVAADIADAARSGPSAARDIRLGVVLALGYWTKAVFFPVAVVAIVAYAAATVRESRRRMLPRLLMTAVLLSAPLIVAQSRSQGRPSFGETGRLNYRWYVGGASRAVPIAETEEATRARRSPAAVALTSAPGATLFTGSVDGSFPYWYDPSRYEPAGVGPLSAAAQWSVLTFNAHWLRATAGILFAMAALALVAAAMRAAPRWARLWAVAPAVAMLGLYLLTHPEGRMGAASLVCVLLAMITLCDVGDAGRRPAIAAAECAALALLAVFAIGHTTNRIPHAPSPSLANASTLAKDFQSAGLHAGDRIGIVGEPFGMRWAHETGARIVVMIPLRQGAPVTDSTLAAVARESAARGVSLAAIVYPAAASVRSTRATRVNDRWAMWRAR